MDTGLAQYSSGSRAKSQEALEKKERYHASQRALLECLFYHVSSDLCTVSGRDLYRPAHTTRVVLAGLSGRGDRRKYFLQEDFLLLPDIDKMELYPCCGPSGSFGMANPLLLVGDIPGGFGGSRRKP